MTTEHNSHYTGQCTFGRSQGCYRKKLEVNLSCKSVHFSTKSQTTNNLHFVGDMVSVKLLLLWWLQLMLLNVFQTPWQF